MNVLSVKLVVFVYTKVQYGQQISDISQVSEREGCTVHPWAYPGFKHLPAHDQNQGIVIPIS